MLNEFLKNGLVRTFKRSIEIHVSIVGVWDLVTKTKSPKLIPVIFLFFNV